MINKNIKVGGLGMGKKVLGKCLMLAMVFSRGSAFGLEAVPVAAIQSKLCPNEFWLNRQESILNACWKSVSPPVPGPGEAVVFGFLSYESNICYLPCDYQQFYQNEGAKNE